MTDTAPARIIVVGLGPAGTEYMLPAARRALVSVAAAYVRTERHPAVEELRAHGVTLISFDEVYERQPTFDAVYDTIVDTLMTVAREQRRIAYGVPGSPVLAERTVTKLLERCRDTDIEIDIVPGLSFADLAWAQVGIDAMDRGRVLDAHRVGDELDDASGPVLIAQVDDAFVASDVKLALLERCAPETPVTILQRLGLRDARVATVPLAELDHACAPDHLTAVFVDLGASGTAMQDLLAVAAQLRAPGGCPWDAEQTHQSLAKYLIEEAYEAVDAIEALQTEATTGEIDAGAYAELEAELGDVLYQVVFHSDIAQAAGAFSFDDVARGIRDKLIRRHPHVFGDVVATTADEVLENWDAIKRSEKTGTSVVADIPNALPALQYSDTLLRKVLALGIPQDALVDDPERAVAAWLASDDAAVSEAMVGRIAAALVQWARARGIDPEHALRTWNRELAERVIAFEAEIGDDRTDIAARWRSFEA